MVVAGTSLSGYPIVATQIYMDGVLKLQTKNSLCQCDIANLCGNAFSRGAGLGRIGRYFQIKR